jgi:hypothetical protein
MGWAKPNDAGAQTFATQGKQCSAPTWMTEEEHPRTDPFLRQGKLKVGHYKTDGKTKISQGALC